MEESQKELVQVSKRFLAEVCQRFEASILGDIVFEFRDAIRKAEGKMGGNHESDEVR